MNAINAINDSTHLDHCYIDHSLNIEHLSHLFIFFFSVIIFLT